ncbi:MAG: hypothetical protein QOJ45_1351 [Verrucomicrobiota bacterium]|jgi:hypothetical protein
MRIHRTHIIGKAFCLVFGAAFVAASSWASVVWDLNPQPRQNAPVGSSSHTYTSQGYSITAYGFDNNAGIGSPHQLFYKNVAPIGGAVEFGLGLTNTPDNEIQAGLHFIQFDFTSMLAAGLLHGQISVGSIQANEAFAIYGSNALGTLGIQLGGAYGSTFDNQFVNLPNFGQYNYYSIVAAANDVLPIAIQADLPPVPEVNAILPIAALILLLLAARAHQQRVRRPA